MDFQLPAEDDPRRLAIREWLAANPDPTGRQLAEAGYVAPHWPAPWGLGADAIHQLIIDDELHRAKVRRPTNPIGIGWAGPTLLFAGTPEQHARYLFPLLSGEEFWCQLFSEPGAGSDLANLGTRAVRDGDEFVVNGQKIWTSGAQYAKYGILIARTDPDLPKHKGVSYFVCPMDLPGIEIRPITEMTGGHTFNEVFFTDVRLPANSVVGDLGEVLGDQRRFAPRTDVEKRGPEPAAGVVDQHVDAPGALDRLGEHRIDRCGVAHVAHPGQTAASERLDAVAQPRKPHLIPVDGDHVGTKAGDAQRDRPAKPPRRPGDDHPAILQAGPSGPDGLVGLADERLGHQSPPLPSSGWASSPEAAASASAMPLARSATAAR